MANKREWSVKELRRAMAEDLRRCHTELERSCCRAICEREIREYLRETVDVDGVE